MEYKSINHPICFCNVFLNTNFLYLPILADINAQLFMYILIEIQIKFFHVTPTFLPSLPHFVSHLHTHFFFVFVIDV